MSPDSIKLFQRKKVDFVPNVVMKTVHRAGGKFTSKDDPNAEAKEVPVMGAEALKAHHEWRMIKSPKKSPSPKKRRRNTNATTASRKNRPRKTLTLNAQQVAASTIPTPDEALSTPGKKRRSKKRDEEETIEETGKTDFSKLIVNSPEEETSVEESNKERLEETVEEVPTPPNLREEQLTLRRSGRIPKAPQTCLYGAVKYDTLRK